MEQNYSLRINNKSGAAQNVAVFQVNNPSVGFSLVWLAQMISDKGNYPFTWKTNWGLGWGHTLQPLGTGVIYQSGQSATEVQPNTASGVNVLPITYINENFSSKSAYYNQQLQSGVMQVTTDKSFTVSQSLKMSVAVYVNNKPILAEQGAPNTQYEFNTNMSYYLTVTDYPEGAVIPSFDQSTDSSRLFKKILAISQPTQVTFPDGVYDLQYNLTDTLEFTPVG